MSQFEMEYIMSTMTKRQRVLNCLANGNGLTANEAKSRFSVGNLRATISDIKSQVATGKTRYSMNDTHPGVRTYGYDKFGSRYAL